MPFQKGNTYGKNAPGRPPVGQASSELLRAMGELPYKKGASQTRRQKAAEVFWQQAVDGNLQAYLMILERTEGKVVDKSESSGELRIRVVFEDAAASGTGADDGG